MKPGSQWGDSTLLGPLYSLTIVKQPSVLQEKSWPTGSDREDGKCIVLLIAGQFSLFIPPKNIRKWGIYRNGTLLT